MMDIGISFVFFYSLFLLCLGSALGCLSWRFPRKKENQWKQEARIFLDINTDKPDETFTSFLQGRSCCTNCQRTLAVRDLLPVISYLINKCHCRFCHYPISLRYPVIEILYTLILIPLLWIADTPAELLVFILLFSALILAAIVDIEHLFIPDEANLLILACGLSLPLLHHTSLENHVIGMLIGYGILYLLRGVYLYIKKVEMIGLGDAKLLSAIGAWLGVTNLPSVVLIASISAIIFILLTGNRRDRKIPFGPFIVSASMIVFYSHSLGL